MSTKAIRKAIVTQIRSANGSGGYTYKLDRTDPDQVVSGKFSHPPHGRSPFVCVYTASIGETEGPTTRSYLQRGTWIVTAWVDADPKRPESRQDAAEDLLDDLRRAIRADITLGGNVLTCETEAIPWDEAMQGEDQADQGKVLMAINAVWRETR